MRIIAFDLKQSNEVKLKCLNYHLIPFFIIILIIYTQIDFITSYLHFNRL